MSEQTKEPWPDDEDSLPGIREQERRESSLTVEATWDEPLTGQAEVDRIGAELSAQPPPPEAVVNTTFTLQHMIKVPKGWLQVLVEEGEPTLTQAELVSLLRWTADSLAGERVPMTYQLGDEWNEAKRLEFDMNQYRENADRVDAMVAEQSK